MCNQNLKAKTNSTLEIEVKTAYDAQDWTKLENEFESQNEAKQLIFTD